VSRSLRLKRIGAETLARTPLSLPAFRAYEALVALRRGRSDAADDGLPLPPARLRVRVSGTADPRWFLESGRRDAALIREAARATGTAIDELGRILDFGCGCGRVTRHWNGLAATEVHGSDYGAALVDWCRRNLTFARFETNDLAPPTAYEDGRFDLVYAVSVFTHLPDELARAWIAELRRICAPSGLVILTTHGDRYLDRLTARERARYGRGEPVVRRPRGAGSNLCSAHHPRAYVEGELADGLSALRFRPGDDVMPQDLFVFRVESA
jgi:SAM-dependent methyltransferase